MKNKYYIAVFLYLGLLGATLRNHAYPTDLAYYHLDNNVISFKVSFEEYNSILGSYVDPKIFFVIRPAEDLPDGKVQLCHFDDDTKFVRCPIDTNNKAWVIQTQMERRVPITQDQKKDVIDQSPVLNLDQLD